MKNYFKVFSWFFQDWGFAQIESDESVVRRRGSTQVREFTLALKPRADITRSPKQGYQWPHEKDMCPTKIKKKRLGVWTVYINLQIFVMKLNT